MLLFVVILYTFWLPSGTCKDIPQSTDSIIEELQKRLVQQERKLEKQERKLEKQERKLEQHERKLERQEGKLGQQEGRLGQQDRLLENVVAESGVTRELLEKAVISVSI